jgi:hypothetical protein
MHVMHCQCPPGSGKLQLLQPSPRLNVGRLDRLCSCIGVNLIEGSCINWIAPVPLARSPHHNLRVTSWRSQTCNVTFYSPTILDTSAHLDRLAISPPSQACFV